ncbi:MAG TPA: hypothetical protein VH308_08840 [Terracidiphilus sp.]|nr:hypothetical protein [Terracidiphilus sp.]
MTGGAVLGVQITPRYPTRIVRGSLYGAVDAITFLWANEHYNSCMADLESG